MEARLSHRPAGTPRAAVTLRTVTFMQSARRMEAGWEHQRGTTLHQCGSSSSGAPSHGCRCPECACSTAASVGYEERLVPHRRGGSSGGGVRKDGARGERLRSTHAAARLPIGGGRCTVRRHRCTLHSAVCEGVGRVRRVHPLKKCCCNMCLEVGEHGAHSSSLTLTQSGAKQ